MARPLLLASVASAEYHRILIDNQGQTRGMGEGFLFLQKSLARIFPGTKRRRNGLSPGRDETMKHVHVNLSSKSALDAAIALHHSRMWARADHRTVVGYLSSEYAPYLLARVGLYTGGYVAMTDASIDAAFRDPSADVYELEPATLRRGHPDTMRSPTWTGGTPVAKRSV